MAEHRIGEYDEVVDVEEHGRVAYPQHADALGRRRMMHARLFAAVAERLDLVVGDRVHGQDGVQFLIARRLCVASNSSILHWKIA